MTTTTYDLDTVKAAILDICDRFPDRINPTDDDGDTCCLYRGEIGGETAHCLAGQWFVELGVLPEDNGEIENEPASTVALHLGVNLTPEADDFLNEAQQYADGLHHKVFIHHKVFTRQKWGDVGAAIRNDFQ